MAQTLEGPYTPVDIAVPTEAHNIYYAFSPTDQTHLLVHIGLGDNPPSCNPFPVCTNGTTPGACGVSPPPNWAKPTCAPNMTTVIHYSHSLDGPWQIHPLDLPNPHGLEHGGSNPAPLLLANGTWLMMTRGPNQRTLPNGTKQHYQNVFLFRAASWKGPWVMVPGTGEYGALNINYAGSAVQTEDPTLWKGRRGCASSN